METSDDVAAALLRAARKKSPHVQREGLGLSHNATLDVTPCYSTRHRACRSFKVSPRLTQLTSSPGPWRTYSVAANDLRVDLACRDDVEMFVGKPAPLLLHFALHLLSVTLDTISVHDQYLC